MATSIPWVNNWGRSYRITLGVREFTEEGKAEFIVPAEVVGVYRSPVVSEGDTIPSDAFSMDNLEDPRGFTFEFESQQIASSSSASSERSHLTLYNLSKEAKRILFQPNCICIVECGYEGKVVKAYTGDVVSIVPRNNLPDISYKIQLSSQGNAIRNTVINTHYDEGISKGDIILDMAKRFPATSINTYGLDSLKDRYKTGGTGFTGSLLTNFDKYCKSHNMEYIFSNNKISIIPFRLLGADYDAFSRTNYTLDADSIKNVLEKADYSGKGLGEVQNTVRKLQLNTYYLPIDIGQFLTIPVTSELKQYAGTYIVKGRRIILQSKGNAWDVVLDIESMAQ